MGPAPKILVVEDEWMIANHLRVVLEGIGYPVCGVAATADEAVKLAREEKPALIVMDVRLSGEGDGIDAAARIGGRGRPAIVFVTASSDRQTLERMNAQRPAAVLLKPIRLSELKEVLARVCPLR